MDYSKLDQYFERFEVMCLENSWHGGARYKELWEQAESKEEFLKLIAKDPEVRYKQATAILFKNDFHYLRDFFGDEEFKTYSDVGGVKVGNDTFNVVVPNGYGDGVTRCRMVEKGTPWPSDAFTFWGCINGTDINIYEYDCGSDVERHLDGTRYGCFYNGTGSFVVFERWD